jgi:hypothetical protein
LFRNGLRETYLDQRHVLHRGDHVIDRVGVSIHRHGVALASHLELSMEGAIQNMIEVLPKT